LTADKGLPSSLGVGRGAKSPHRKKKKKACYEESHMASNFDGFFGTTQATENRYEI